MTESAVPEEGLQMKSRKLLQAFIIGVVVGVSAQALHAQSYKVYMMGGGSILSDHHSYTVYGASFSSKYEIGTSFTVGAEIPVTRIFSAEGSYGYVRNDLAVTNLVNSTTPNREIKYGIQDQRISADIVAHASKPFNSVLPYLVAGLELDRFSATGTGTATAQNEGFNGVPNSLLSPDNRFGFNFGGGLDISLTHLLAVRLDARDHIFNSPTFGLPSAATSSFTAYYPVSGRAQDLVCSAGIVFRFGRLPRL